MMPGYTGYIPQQRQITGARYGLGARMAVAEHDRIQERYDILQNTGTQAMVNQSKMRPVDTYSVKETNERLHAKGAARTMATTKYSPTLGVMTGTTIHLPQKQHDAALGKSRQLWSKEVASAMGSRKRVGVDSGRSAREVSSARPASRDTGSAVSGAPRAATAGARTRTRGGLRTESSQPIIRRPQTFVNSAAYPEKPRGHMWDVGRAGVYSGIPGVDTRKL